MRGYSRGRWAAVAGMVTAALLAASAATACDAEKIIQHFGMKKVPQEGVWFSLSYASPDRVDGAALPPRYHGQPRNVGSAIFAVETIQDFSALHRLQTDETWHFYAGQPIDLLLLYPDGSGREITLGPDVLDGQVPQFTVPAGVWQGSAPIASAGKACSFFGTQLAPAFDYADFEIGYRDDLVHQYPAFARRIGQLTRAEFAVKPATVAPAPVPPAATVIQSAEVSPASVSTGVSLRELVGRGAPAGSTRVSVALFSLATGKATAESYNRDAEEIFIVTAGSGSVTLGDKVVPVSAGMTIHVPPTLPHVVAAAKDAALDFYAVSSPAFTPSDYFLVPTPK